MVLTEDRGEATNRKRRRHVPFSFALLWWGCVSAAVAMPAAISSWNMRDILGESGRAGLVFSFGVGAALHAMLALLLLILWMPSSRKQVLLFIVTHVLAFPLVVLAVLIVRRVFVLY